MSAADAVSAAAVVTPADAVSAAGAPIVSVGVDLVETERIARALARHPVRFLERHFTAAECRECGRRPYRLAARWAAKEAAAKALGTGVGPIAWREIEITSEPSGAPRIHLHGRAAEVAARRGLTAWSVSLSDTRSAAVAVVVALGARG